MVRHGILLALLILVAGPAPAAGQNDQLEELARQYFAALQSEGMAASARFLHPEALAEFKAFLLPVYEMEAEAGQREFIDLTFGADASLADVRVMDPLDFTNGFLGFVTRQVESLNVRFDRFEVLGVVEEGDVRHVLTRITVGMQPIERTDFEVLSYRPYGESWRLQLNGELRGLAQALRTNLTDR